MLVGSSKIEKHLLVLKNSRAPVGYGETFSGEQWWISNRGKKEPATYLGGAKISSSSRTERGNLEKGVREGNKMRGDSIATYEETEREMHISDKGGFEEQLLLPYLHYYLERVFLRCLASQRK